MAGRAYDKRRSEAVVHVSSGFILAEFKRNLGKGFYGDKTLEGLARKIILELWRRNPALLEDISKLTAQKYGDYLKKEYGSANFRKKLVKEFNERKAEKIRRETEKQLEDMQREIMSESSVNDIMNDTIFTNVLSIDNDIDKI